MDNTVGKQIEQLETQAASLTARREALQIKRRETIEQADLLQMQAGELILAGQGADKIMGRLEALQKQVSLYDAGIDAAAGQLAPIDAALDALRKNLAAEQVQQMLAEAAPVFANCKLQAHLLADELVKAQNLYQQIYPLAEVAGQAPEYWCYQPQYAGMLDPALPNTLAKIGTDRFFHSWTGG